MYLEKLRNAETAQINIDTVTKLCGMPGLEIHELVCSEKFPVPMGWTGKTAWAVIDVAAWRKWVASGVPQEQAVIVVRTVFLADTVLSVIGLDEDRLQAKIDCGDFPRPTIYQGVPCWGKVKMRNFFVAVDDNNHWASATYFYNAFTCWSMAWPGLHR